VCGGCSRGGRGSNVNSPRRVTRVTGKKGDVQAAFLEQLVEGAPVTEAAEAVTVSRKTLYQWRREDPDFAAAWELAYEQGTDKLEAEAQRRAHDGVPDFRLDREGNEHPLIRYSDTLLIFLLKGRRPEKYRDNVAHEVGGKGGAPIGVEVRLSDDSAERVLAGLVASGLVQPGPAAASDTES
jgi:hypothetical protein